VSLGFERAALLPSADCALDLAVAEDICWLVSARADPLATCAVLAETVGASALSAPAALTALGASVVAAVADCAVVACGVLRRALRPAACRAEALGFAARIT